MPARKTWVFWERYKDIWYPVFELTPLDKESWSGKTYIDWLTGLMPDVEATPENYRVLPKGRKPGKK